MKIDSELVLIKRLKELQLKGVALVGTVLLAFLVGIFNFISQIAYDNVSGDTET